MKSKHNLEIDISDEYCDFTTKYGGWLGYTTIEAWGDSLEQCLDNATVGICDQDGGEYDTIEADEDWMQVKIIQKFNEVTGANKSDRQ